MKTNILHPKMKKLKFALTVSALLLTSIALNAQTQDREGKQSCSLSHSLSFSMVSVTDDNWNGLYYPFYDIMWYPQRQFHPLPGLLYTLSAHGWNVRIGFNGLIISQHDESNGYSNQQKESWSRLMVGLGGISDIRKFSILYGADFSGLINHSNYSYTYEDPQYNQKNTTKDEALGINPYLGVRYSLNKRFSLAFESSARFETYRYSWRNTPSQGQSYSGSSNGNRASLYLLNQVRVDFQF
jgi:hypothetical protein